MPYDQQHAKADERGKWGRKSCEAVGRTGASMLCVVCTSERGQPGLHLWTHSFVLDWPGAQSRLAYHETAAILDDRQQLSFARETLRLPLDGPGWQSKINETEKGREGKVEAFLSGDGEPSCLGKGDERARVNRGEWSRNVPVFWILGGVCEGPT